MSVLKEQFNLTYADLKRITGLKTDRSITQRIQGIVALNANDIAALCSFTEKQAEKDDSLKAHVFAPTDFYEKA